VFDFHLQVFELECSPGARLVCVVTRGLKNLEDVFQLVLQAFGVLRDEVLGLFGRNDFFLDHLFLDHLLFGSLLGCIFGLFPFILQFLFPLLDFEWGELFDAVHVRQGLSDVWEVSQYIVVSDGFARDVVLDVAVFETEHDLFRLLHQDLARFKHACKINEVCVLALNLGYEIEFLNAKKVILVVFASFQNF